MWEVGSRPPAYFKFGLRKHRMLTFTRVMVIVTTLCAQALSANAQTTKTIKKPLPVANQQVHYIGLVMANEARPTREGLVTVAHALLVRATARKDRSIKNAALEKNQFTKLVKQPTAAMNALAAQMYRDWNYGKGKPTVEVALQQKYAGCSYFHTPQVNPDWAKRFKKLGGYCGFVAGHHLYRDPRNRVYAYR